MPTLHATVVQYFSSYFLYPQISHHHYYCCTQSMLAYLYLRSFHCLLHSQNLTSAIILLLLEVQIFVVVSERTLSVCLVSFLSGKMTGYRILGCPICSPSTLELLFYCLLGSIEDTGEFAIHLTIAP